MSDITAALLPEAGVGPGQANASTGANQPSIPSMAESDAAAAATSPGTEPQPDLGSQRGVLWRAAIYCADATRDERIRWYTFISQCVISLMIVGFAIAMLSKACYGPTSIYLTIITGVLASYLPSTELYAGHQSSTTAGTAGGQQQSSTGDNTAAAGQPQDVEQQQQTTGATSPQMTSADKQMSLARFAMMNILCVTVLVFSFVQISQSRDKEGVARAGQVVPAENTYLPVITAIHGFYMPPPGRAKSPRPAV